MLYFLLIGIDVSDKLLMYPMHHTPEVYKASAASSFARPNPMERFLRLPLPAFLTLFAVSLTLLTGCSSGDPSLSGARAELRSNNYERALAFVDAAIQADPANADAYLLRGDIYLALFESSDSNADKSRYATEMAAAYTRAGQLNPARQLGQIRMMQAYGELMDSGVRFYAEGAENEDPEQFRTAARYFTDAGILMPDSTTAHLYAGEAYIQAGDYEAAAEPFHTAINAGTNETYPYLFLGQLYISQDRADDALQILELATERFPNEPIIEGELLNAYAVAGQTERALAAYARTIDQHPEEPLYRYNYGTFLFQAGRYDDAIEQLTIAAELDPDHPQTFVNLGASYLNQAATANEELNEMPSQNTPEAQALLQQRNEFLRQSVIPLERARELLEDDDGAEVQTICNHLFRAYYQLGDEDGWRRSAECAGIDLD